MLSSKAGVSPASRRASNCRAFTEWSTFHSALHGSRFGLWWPPRMLEASATAATARRFFCLPSTACAAVRSDNFAWMISTGIARSSPCGTKCRKTQEFPLTREVGDAIIQYIREVRPKCEHREIFITLRAPWRPVSHVGFYDGIRERIDALGIDLARRGPHSLRHACATHLMTQGLSLK